jgi:hypothetical protein
LLPELLPSQITGRSELLLPEITDGFVGLSGDCRVTTVAAAKKKDTTSPVVYLRVFIIPSWYEIKKQAARLSPLWRPVAFRHHLAMIVALSTFQVIQPLILLCGRPEKYDDILHEKQDIVPHCLSGIFVIELVRYGVLGKLFF